MQLELNIAIFWYVYQPVPWVRSVQAGSSPGQARCSGGRRYKQQLQVGNNFFSSHSLFQLDDVTRSQDHKNVQVPYRSIGIQPDLYVNLLAFLIGILTSGLRICGSRLQEIFSIY